MKDTSRKDPVDGIEKGPDEREQKQSAAPLPALRELLSVPGKIGYRAHCTQIEQTSLHPPVNGGGRVTTSGCWNFCHSAYLTDLTSFSGTA